MCLAPRSGKSLMVSCQRRQRTLTDLNSQDKKFPCWRCALQRWTGLISINLKRRMD
jgi:hypothetical protein